MIKFNDRRGRPRRVIDFDLRDHLGGHGMAGRLFPDVSTAAGIDTGLSQRVESERALDPTKAVICRLAYCRHIMSITAVEAWFATVVAFPQLLDSSGALAKPEFALGCAAREDDMCELLDLLTDGGICCLT